MQREEDMDGVVVACREGGEDALRVSADDGKRQVHGVPPSILDRPHATCSSHQHSSYTIAVLLARREYGHEAC